MSALLITAGGMQLYAYEVQSNGFVLKGFDKDSIIVNNLVSEIRENKPHFEEFFGEKLSGIPVEILVPQNQGDYKRITHNFLPGWSQGVAIPGQRRIILRPADYYSPGQFREILMHELAHIYLAQVVYPAEVPLWFNEGVAMYMSNKNISWEEGIAIGNALVGNNIIDFQNIDSLLNFGETKARLAYLQSFLAVRYLIESHGSRIISAILQSCSRGEKFEQAFLNFTGYDLIDFEFDVYQDIKSNYRWMTVLQFSNILWILMVILVITVFISIKYRNRRKLRNWDLLEEE